MGRTNGIDLHQLKEMWRIADKYDTRIHAEAYGGSIYQMHKAGKLALLGPRYIYSTPLAAPLMSFRYWQTQGPMWE